MVKRKESDCTLVWHQELQRSKRQRLSNDTSPYRSQATQTFETYIPGCEDCRKRKGIRNILPRIEQSPEARVLEWAESLPELEEMSEPSLPSLKRQKTNGSDTTRDLKTQFLQSGVEMYEAEPLDQECEYLGGDLMPGICLKYPEEKLNGVINRAGAKNEGHVQKDILPWTVPSVNDLCISGEWTGDMAIFEEQVHTDWTSSKLMGSTKPRPDYVAGLSASAFSRENLEEIRQFEEQGLLEKARLRVNPTMLAPFLVCEAKSGTAGLTKAEKQNIHAGAIVTRALFELHKTAYDELETIYEQILVWTIDLNHESVRIYGHYGKLNKEGNLLFYRHQFGDIRLRQRAERFIPYNFVRNIYQDFAPKHLDRITKALSRIRERRSSGQSQINVSDSSGNARGHLTI